MNEYERYLFDLNGYLVVEDFLTPAEVAALNEAIDRNPDRIVERDSPLKPSSTLKGDFVRGDLEGMLMWPKPWCQPFRELIDHPKLVPYLDELLGPRFLLDHIYGIAMSRGAQGLHLHGGGTRAAEDDSDHGETHYYFRYHNGRIRNGLTVTTFVLADEGPGDGGFMCIPGSHKSNFPLPQDVVSHDRDIGVVKEVTARAGSAIIFTEALAHGTLPWRASHQRRAVLYKYTSGVSAGSQNYLSQGVEEALGEFTAEQRARMNPVPSRSW